MKLKISFLENTVAALFGLASFLLFGIFLALSLPPSVIFLTPFWWYTLGPVGVLVCYTLKRRLKEQPSASFRWAFVMTVFVLVLVLSVYNFGMSILNTWGSGYVVSYEEDELVARFFGYDPKPFFFYALLCLAVAFALKPKKQKKVMDVISEKVE